jgi:hypothetical protein
MSFSCLKGWDNYSGNGRAKQADIDSWEKKTARLSASAEKRVVFALATSN